MSGVEERWHGVFLSDQHVGDILQRGDTTRFLFAEDYWEREDRRVLGLWFENNPGASPKASMRVPVWFSNLLPEGRLREWIAEDRGVSSQREIELLLRIGHDLPGAVIVREGGSARDGEWLDGAGQVPHPEVASGLKFSLAGVGLKFSMLQAQDRLVLPASGTLGDWIVKMPERSFPAVPSNEAAMMSLAGSAGIDVPEHRLVHRDELAALPDHIWPANETLAYAVRRFDRSNGSRIHIEDFAQIRSKYPVEKYEGTFETVAALCYRGEDIWSLQEWARRVAFNIAIGNGDAHLKNWSLIYPDGRRPKLSPVYDLVSTVEHLPGDDAGLKFTGTKLFERIRAGGFFEVERRLGAVGADLESHAGEVIAAVEQHAASLSERYPHAASTLTWVAANASRVRSQLRL